MSAALGIDLDAYRRFFAEEIQIASHLRTPALVEALATVPRERFLPPGPWIVRGEADVQSPPRATPGDDPRFVYHNVAVALDPSRQLFNGAPGLMAAAIDALALTPGARILHLGAGTGYYTAVIAEAIGPSGRVVGLEVDAELAERAGRNLAAWPSAAVHHGDGRDPIDGPFDAILINAGVTHAEPWWLDALVDGGRLVLPLTAAFAPPGSPAGRLSKGLLLSVVKDAGTSAHPARVMTFVTIYSALGLRDEAANTALGQALRRQPFPAITRLRVDAHTLEPGCWCHTARGCWS
jgi:protein-L-isoaspartate(D-aspartate) O-methyltransferase